MQDRSIVMKYNNVIFFDSICKLCNFSVKFVYKYDKNELFYFSALDSACFRQLNLDEGLKQPDSVIFLCDGKIYTESDAVMQILEKLGMPWNLLAAGKIIPLVWRNRIYRFVANNRLRFRQNPGNCNLSNGIPESRIIR